jgi:hypothetical protein
MTLITLFFSFSSFSKNREQQLTRKLPGNIPLSILIILANIAKFAALKPSNNIKPISEKLKNKSIESPQLECGVNSKKQLQWNKVLTQTGTL